MAGGSCTGEGALFYEEPCYSLREGLHAEALTCLSDRAPQAMSTEKLPTHGIFASDVYSIASEYLQAGLIDNG